MESETVSSNEPNRINEVVEKSNQTESDSSNNYHQKTLKVMLSWLGYLSRDSSRDTGGSASTTDRSGYSYQ